MSYISHLYSIYFAPRGNIRMAELGMQIAQQYLRPTDKLIGVIGDAGSGKSMLVKGMFPGLELTNDDEGVNVRPLPLLEMLDELRTKYDLSILLSTHDFATLGQFADKVILLNKKVLKSGPPEEILSSPEFYETFHLRVGKGGSFGIPS